jgi:hypothetical protein
MIRRIFLATLFVYALLLATSPLVGAEEKHPQNAFTSFCRELGGKPKREATHVVSCTEPGGTKTTCDFNDKKNPSCVTVSPPEMTGDSGSESVPDQNLQAQTENVQPVEASGTGVIVTDAGSAQEAPPSATDGQIESTSEPVNPVDASGTVVETDDAITPLSPVEVESLPVFGQ